MSRFVNKAATVEIPLANGDKIWVRERLTATEEAELTRSLIRVRFDPGENQVRMEEGDWHLQRVAVVRAYVTGWNFRDGDAEMPFSLGAIEPLVTATGNESAEAVEELQKNWKKWATLFCFLGLWKW